MNDRIREFVDELFEDAPNKRRIMDIKEELLSNMNEKYEDLLRQGKSEDEVFNIVASGIGDIDELISDVSEVDRQTFAANATKGRYGPLMIAIGVAMYIIGVAVLIIMSELFGQDEIGVVAMLCIAAIATVMVIYGASLKKTRYQREDDTFVEEYKEKMSTGGKPSRMYGAVSSTLWSIIVLTYFIVSFLTWQWHITWVVFLIGAVVQQILRALIYKNMNLGGIIWTTAVVAYFIISFLTFKWNITWIIFLVAAAVQQVIRLVGIWREE